MSFSLKKKYTQDIDILKMALLYMTQISFVYYKSFNYDLYVKKIVKFIYYTGLHRNISVSFYMNNESDTSSAIFRQLMMDLMRKHFIVYYVYNNHHHHEMK